MPGPAPSYQPTFTDEQVGQCRRVVRQHTAPQAQVYRAKLALLLHEAPTLDNVSAGRRLGKHENWVRYWRRRWATDGFRLTDKPGRGRKPTLSPPPGGHGDGAGLRTPGPAGRTAQPLQHRRVGPAGERPPRRAADQPEQHLAPAGPARAPALAAAVLDRSA